MTDPPTLPPPSPDTLLAELLDGGMQIDAPEMPANASGANTQSPVRLVPVHANMPESRAARHDETPVRPALPDGIQEHPVLTAWLRRANHHVVNAAFPASHALTFDAVDVNVDVVPATQLEPRPQIQQPVAAAHPEIEPVPAPTPVAQQPAPVPTPAAPTREATYARVVADDHPETQRQMALAIQRSLADVGPSTSQPQQATDLPRTTEEFQAAMATAREEGRLSARQSAAQTFSGEQAREEFTFPVPQTAPSSPVRIPVPVATQPAPVAAPVSSPEARQNAQHPAVATENRGRFSPSTANLPRPAAHTATQRGISRLLEYARAVAKDAVHELLRELQASGVLSPRPAASMHAEPVPMETDEAPAAPSPDPAQAPAVHASPAIQKGIAAAKLVHVPTEVMKSLRSFNKFRGRERRAGQTENAARARMWFEYTISTLRNQFQDLGWDQIHSALPMLFEGDALTWWHHLCQTSSDQRPYPATEEAFKEAFLAEFGREVRNPAQSAREAFASGRINQGTGSIASYVQKFQKNVALAYDMSMSDQIHWFLRGLNPEMRAECATDAAGRDWNALQPLIQYAHGAEQRMRAKQWNQSQQYQYQRPNKRAQVAAPVAVKKQGRDHQPAPGERPSQRRRLGNGPSTSSRPSQSNSQRDSPKQLADDHFGPPAAKNKKFPHLNNGEVVYRFNNDLCCHCNRKGHKAYDCPNPEHEDGKRI